MPYCLCEDRQKEECIRKDEEHKVLVVTVAQTVVDERAVVVKRLYAPSTSVAVE
jgi:hypothetical protein